MNKLSLHELLSLKGKKFQSMNILHYPIWLFCLSTHYVKTLHNWIYKEIVSEMCSKQRHAGKNYSNEGMILSKKCTEMSQEKHSMKWEKNLCRVRWYHCNVSQLEDCTSSYYNLFAANTMKKSHFKQLQN